MGFYIQWKQTLNKISLVGLIGGIVLAQVLRYPLMVLVPGTLVPGWSAGSLFQGQLLALAGAILVIAIGLIAAWWVRVDSRRAGLWLGALAGGMAAAVMYVTLGAAAAGVIGSRAVLQHGLRPVANDMELIRLTAEVATGTIWWTYLMFWVAVLLGIALGATGGVLVRPSSNPIDWRAFRVTGGIPLAIVAIANAQALIVAIALFTLLEHSIGQIATRYHLDLPATYIMGISGLPVLSAMLPFMLTLAGLYGVARAESHANEPSRWIGSPMAVAAFYLCLALGIPLLGLALLAQYLDTGAALVVIGGCIMGLILAVLFFRLAAEARERLEQTGVLPPRTRRQILAMIGYAVALSILLVWTFFHQILIILAAGAVALVVAVIIGWRDMRFRPNPKITRLASWQSAFQTHVSAAMTTLIGVSLVALVAIPVPLTLNLIMVRMTPVLTDYGGAVGAEVDFTLPILVEQLYSWQAQAIWLTLGAVGLIVLLVTALVWLILQYLSRRKTPPPIAHPEVETAV